MRKRYELTLIFVFLLALNLPHINKAFHIDDWAFLRVADLIIENPLNPYKKSLPYLGEEVEISKEFPHPPLFPGLLALVNITLGEGELNMHLVSLLFSLLAAFSFYFLSLRFGMDPLFNTLILLSTPVYLVNSQNVMSDIPALSLFLLTLLLLSSGAEKESKTRLILGGVILGLSLMIRYSNLFLIPLSFLFILINRRRLTLILPTISLGLIIFLPWCYQNLLSLGNIHLITSWPIFKIMSPWGIIGRLITGLIHLGGATIFFPFLLLLLIRNPWDIIKFLLIYLVSFLLLDNLDLPIISTSQMVLGALYLSIGLGWILMSLGHIIGHLFIGHMERESSIILFLNVWFIVYLGTSVLFLPFGSSRYLLPALPPLVMMFWDRLQRVITYERTKRRINVLSFIFTLTLGMAIARADYNLANVYKNFSGLVKTEMTHEGSKVWFNGEWGFRYYMEKAGLRYLLRNEADLKRDDYIIATTNSLTHELGSRVQLDLESVRIIPYMDPLGIKTMDSASFAGFYSNMMGLLPFYYSHTPLEKFFVSKVGGGVIIHERLMDRLEANTLLYKREFMYRTWIEIDGDKRCVFFEHPPASISLDVNITHLSRLSFGIAMVPASWERGSDGMGFTIKIREKEKEEVRFHQYLNPMDHPEHRRWFDHHIDLHRYSGKRITLVFETNPGPFDKNSYDWGGWSDPRIEVVIK